MILRVNSVHLKEVCKSTSSFLEAEYRFRISFLSKFMQKIIERFLLSVLVLNLRFLNFQALNETTVFDQERMKKAFQDMEEHIRKLENERRELVVSQCTDRSNMSQMEEECHLLREKLRVAQTELNNQKANYNQLKMLHEQTDRALTEAQNKVLRAETELQQLNSRMQNSHREFSVYEKEIAKLQGDIEVMKKHLSKIDREKDELLVNINKIKKKKIKLFIYFRTLSLITHLFQNIVDEKTEKIDKLDTQLQERNNSVVNLEFELKELKRKLR